MGEQAKKNNIETARLAGDIFEMVRDKKVPMSVSEIRGRLLSKRAITYTQIAQVDRLLATDARFVRWGKSDFWKLRDWGDFEGNLYPFLIEKTKEVLQAGGPLHYKEIAERIVDIYDIDLTAEQLKRALDDYMPNDIKQKQGMYWSGMEKPGAVTVVGAVEECVSNSTILLTLDEIHRRVSRRLPDFEVRRKTVSGALSHGDQFKRLFGSFWGMAGWDEERVSDMLENTARSGLRHEMKPAEVNNGTFRVTGEYRGFLPDGDAQVFIDSPNTDPQPCGYRADMGYISGLGRLYRAENIGAGSVVRFSVWGEGKNRFMIRTAGGSASGGGVRRGRLYRRTGRGLLSPVFRSGETPAPGLLESVVKEGTRRGESLMLISPRFTPAAPLAALSAERRVIIHTAFPLDDFMAGCLMGIPERRELARAGKRVLDKTGEGIFELYRLDERCGECGGNLVASQISFRSLRAEAVCRDCDEGETAGRSSGEHELTPGELKRMTKLEEKPVGRRHPEETQDGTGILDLYTRRSIHAQALIFEAISKEKDESVRRWLALCFLESVLYFRAFRTGRKHSLIRTESNPWFDFSRSLERRQRDLQVLGGERFYFLEQGSINEVLEGTATLAWTRELGDVPEGAADCSVAMVPYDGLLAAPLEDQICAAWLNLSGESGGSGECGEPTASFESLKSRCMKGSRLNIIVGRELALPGFAIRLDHLLGGIGLELEKTLPEIDLHESANMRRFYSPSVLVYRES